MDSRNKREATETYQIHKGEAHNLMKHCMQKPPHMAIVMLKNSSEKDMKTVFLYCQHIEI